MGNVLHQAWEFWREVGKSKTFGLVGVFALTLAVGGTAFIARQQTQAGSHAEGISRLPLPFFNGGGVSGGYRSLKCGPGYVTGSDGSCRRPGLGQACVPRGASTAGPGCAQGVCVDGKCQPSLTGRACDPTDPNACHQYGGYFYCSGTRSNTGLCRPYCTDSSGRFINCSNGFANLDACPAGAAASNLCQLSYDASHSIGCIANGQVFYCSSSVAVPRPACPTDLSKCQKATPQNYGSINVSTQVICPGQDGNYICSSTYPKCPDVLSSGWHEYTLPTNGSCPQSSFTCADLGGHLNCLLNYSPAGNGGPSQGTLPTSPNPGDVCGSHGGHCASTCGPSTGFNQDPGGGGACHGGLVCCSYDAYDNIHAAPTSTPYPNQFPGSACAPGYVCVPNGSCRGLISGYCNTGSSPTSGLCCQQGTSTNPPQQYQNGQTTPGCPNGTYAPHTGCNGITHTCTTYGFCGIDSCSVGSSC